MRKLLLAPVVPVLLAATVVMAGRGHGDTAAPRQGPSASTPSITSTPQTTTSTSTSAPLPAVAPAAPADPPTTPVSPPAAPDPEPPGGSCDPAAVRDAIDASGGVAPEVTFELTYLACADGFGWAEIMADFGDGATVLLQGSGSDITVLNLGSSVCPTDSGIPESIARRLTPPDEIWDCPR
jgi:hypothetical protein